MKKWLWLPVMLAVLGILSRLPHPAVDIGKLEPVSLVRITRDDDGLRIETDTGAVGCGQDLTSAEEDLRKKAGAEVFLETADFLILPQEADFRPEELLAILRPSCRVCSGGGEMDLTKAAEYLSVHRPAVTLYALQAGVEELETLTMEEGKGNLGRR